MSTLKRFIINAPIALGVTFGLGLVMAGLIHVEYAKLPDKQEKLSFEINADIVDEVIAKPDQKLEKFKRVITPPAPPMIETQKSSLPTHPIADFVGALPDFDRPELNPVTVSLVVSDKDARPLVRIEPIMPPRAQKSGHCKVRFNVSAQGQTYEIKTHYCSQAVFQRASIKAVEKWKYNPKIQNGMAVSRNGVQTRISFNLTDEHGRPIPE